jgi:CheY-like chemotaxis protein
MSSAQKILVADDSLTIRKLVESVLCQEGYEVLIAVTGEECLALAAAQKPNLILLDYILPDKQGTEICRALINSPDTWEIPVLMMSSNGNAIRQLYQDLNNVADYLTKPFAPSVLTAVVGHLLQKEKPAPVVELSAVESAPPQSAAAVEPAMPKEFMDKVSRLLDLMETKPAGTPQPAAEAPDANGSRPEAAPKPRPRRSRKAVATVPMADALLRKFRLAAQKHLRSRVRQIPDWESAREDQAPEDFFLSRLLSKDVLSDLSADLVRATGMPAEAAGALRCPVGLVPLDVVLRHLNSTRATGELRIEIKDEAVLACLDAGEVVFLTTNHPRNYCAGAACDFQSLPHVAIGEAVKAQEEQSLPFFITLNHAGQLPAGARLEELLAVQGEKCLVRAFKSPDATITFFPLSKLPAMVRAARLDISLDQLLLACYRTVDDWFTLERSFPELEAAFVPTPEMEERLLGLKLAPEEKSMMQAVRSGQTIRELSEATRLKSFEVCRILFRFVKLGLVRQGLRRGHDERVDDELAIIAGNCEFTPGNPVTGSEPKTWTETTDPAVEVAPATPSAGPVAESPASTAPWSEPAVENLAATVSGPETPAVIAIPETDTGTIPIASVPIETASVAETAPAAEPSVIVEVAAMAAPAVTGETVLTVPETTTETAGALNGALISQTPVCSTILAGQDAESANPTPVTAPDPASTI